MGKPKFHGQTFVENKYTASSSSAPRYTSLDVLDTSSGSVTTWKISSIKSSIQKPAKIKATIQKQPDYVQVVILDESAYGSELFINSQLVGVAYIWQYPDPARLLEKREQFMSQAMTKYLQAKNRANSYYKVFQVKSATHFCHEHFGERDYVANKSLFAKLVAKLEELETHPHLEEFTLKLS